MSESDQVTPVLPTKPRTRTPLIVGVGIAALALAGAGTFVATRAGGQDAPAADGGETTTVRLGTTEISQPHWAVLTELAAAEGIDLQVRGFSEYTLPNPALAENEIDLNAFQHVLYLGDHNVNTGDDLTPIGPTFIVPLPLYSEKYDSVEEFVDGDQVAIPNDATNQARALFVLEEAGLLSFTGDPAAPTPDDIDQDASTVRVRPVEASQTAGLIRDPDVAGVVVNNNFAKDAGFDLQSFLFADDPSSPGAQPYINVIAARADEADNEAYQRIVELYHSPEVLDLVVESSGGTAVIVDPQEYDAERLAELQDQTEATLQAQD